LCAISLSCFGTFRNSSRQPEAGTDKQRSAGGQNDACRKKNYSSKCSGTVGGSVELGSNIPYMRNR
jgi:hypothetical protein